MHLECNTNVSGVSRILPEYFPIGYKMLRNLTPRLYFLCPFFLGGMSTRQILSADWERILRTFKNLRKKKIGWWYELRHIWRNYNSVRCSDCIRAAIDSFRRHLKCIPAEFFSYGIRFRQHSRCIQGAFRLIWHTPDIRTGFEVACHSILPRMRSECVECCWNAVRIFRKQSECS